MNTNSIDSTKKYSIREAADLTGTCEQFMRKLVREGKLTTTMVHVGDTKIEKHMIHGDSLKKYGSHSTAHTTRTDGRNKYTVYMSKAEYEQFKKVFPNLPSNMTNEGVYEKRMAKKNNK